ncbi:translation initiation factor IF-2-like isoform X2 [Paramacrobiotus metropolitanus]|nr:translation initiation factor IF-2-like isoform X2 [Paramacrobiotus metropolitanus]
MGSFSISVPSFSAPAPIFFMPSYSAPPPAVHFFQSAPVPSVPAPPPEVINTDHQMNFRSAPAPVSAPIPFIPVFDNVRERFPNPVAVPTGDIRVREPTGSGSNQLFRSSLNEMNAPSVNDNFRSQGRPGTVLVDSPIPGDLPIRTRPFAALPAPVSNERTRDNVIPERLALPVPHPGSALPTRASLLGSPGSDPARHRPVDGTGHHHHKPPGHPHKPKVPQWIIPLNWDVATGAVGSAGCGFTVSNCNQNPEVQGFINQVLENSGVKELLRSSTTATRRPTTRKPTSTTGMEINAVPPDSLFIPGELLMNTTITSIAKNLI